MDSVHKRGNPEIQEILVYGLSDNACGRKLFEKNMGRIVPSFNFGHGISRLSTFLWVTGTPKTHISRLTWKALLPAGPCHRPFY